MSKMTTAHKNLINELTLAGFALGDAGDVYDAVVETSSKFVFIMQPEITEGGRYLVGAFIKSTVSGHGDYHGHPAYEGDSYDEALAAFISELAAPTSRG